MKGGPGGPFHVLGRRQKQRERQRRIPGKYDGDKEAAPSSLLCLDEGRETSTA